MAQFAVIGAGPTGVEMAGQIVELSRRSLRDNFRAIDPSQRGSYSSTAARACWPNSAPGWPRKPIEICPGSGSRSTSRQW